MHFHVGLALKKLSKEQLRNIIGAKAESPIKPKILHFKPWMWQVASVAAIFVIVFGMFFNIEKNARYAVDNAIYTHVVFITIEQPKLIRNIRV